MHVQRGARDHQPGVVYAMKGWTSWTRPLRRGVRDDKVRQNGVRGVFAGAWLAEGDAAAAAHCNGTARLCSHKREDRARCPPAAQQG